jgi:hypothetical protein
MTAKAVREARDAMTKVKAVFFGHDLLGGGSNTNGDNNRNEEKTDANKVKTDANGPESDGAKSKSDGAKSDSKSNSDPKTITDGPEGANGGASGSAATASADTLGMVNLLPHHPELKLYIEEFDAINKVTHEYLEALVKERGSIRKRVNP